MSPLAAKPIEILLVEDNPGDVRLTKEALKDARVGNNLHVAMDGVEVLEEIKAEDALRHIPVVILTTSQAEQDVVESYRLRANAYVTKPVDLDQFLKVVGSIEQFWLEIVKLSRP